MFIYFWNSKWDLTGLIFDEGKNKRKRGVELMLSSFIRKATGFPQALPIYSCLHHKRIWEVNIFNILLNWHSEKQRTHANYFLHRIWTSLLDFLTENLEDLCSYLHQSIWGSICLGKECKNQELCLPVYSEKPLKMDWASSQTLTGSRGSTIQGVGEWRTWDRSLTALPFTSVFQVITVLKKKACLDVSWGYCCQEVRHHVQGLSQHVQGLSRSTNFHKAPTVCRVHPRWHSLSSLRGKLRHALRTQSRD